MITYKRTYVLKPGRNYDIQSRYSTYRLSLMSNLSCFDLVGEKEGVYFLKEKEICKKVVMNGHEYIIDYGPKNKSKYAAIYISKYIDRISTYYIPLEWFNDDLVLKDLYWYDRLSQKDRWLKYIEDDKTYEGRKITREIDRVTAHGYFLKIEKRLMENPYTVCIELSLNKELIIELLKLAYKHSGCRTFDEFSLSIKAGFPISLGIHNLFGVDMFSRLVFEEYNGKGYIVIKNYEIYYKNHMMNSLEVPNEEIQIELDFLRANTYKITH